jgi:hypothetical protein
MGEMGETRETGETGETGEKDERKEETIATEDRKTKDRSKTTMKKEAQEHT